MQLIVLQPVYDARKSFGGKAHYVLHKGDNTLFSYGTAIARKTRDGEVIIAHGVNQWDSATSLRHLREWSKQFCDGFTNMTKRDFENLPTWHKKGNE